MGFLEQLEQEAKQQREREAQLALARAEREAFFREVADPTFRQLFDYLKRLTGHLNYLGNRRQVRFSAPAYGKIIGHVNDDLKVRFASDDESRTIDVAGTVTFPKQRAIDLVGEGEITRMQGFARERGLHTNERTRRDGRAMLIAGSFRLSGTVNLRVVIQTSVDKPDFQMLFTNVVDFGQMVKVVPPEQMDEQLMDTLGRFIARVDDDFLREDLADEIRDELARNLHRERRAMVQELTANERERQKAAEADSERSKSAMALAGRFQHRIEQVKRKLSDS